MSKLPLRLKQPIIPVPREDWAQLTSEAAGIRYALSKCGRQDKAVALDADIDFATLSRAKAAQARLSDEDMDAFMDATGCEAPLIARNLRRNYDPGSMRKLETETEEKLRLANERIAQLEAERAVELKLMRDLRV